VRLEAGIALHYGRHAAVRVAALVKPNTDNLSPFNAKLVAALMSLPYWPTTSLNGILRTTAPCESDT
jgi:hypothetical protein